MENKPVRKIGLFDHLRAIYENQSINYWDLLSPESRKTYNVYMVNRLVSMEMSFVDIVNAFQRFWGIVHERESYLFYSQILPRGKRWNKYVKANKEQKYEEWLLRLIAHHYEVGQREAETYLDMMMKTREGQANLKGILEMYGTESRKIKKLVR